MTHQEQGRREGQTIRLVLGDCIKKMQDIPDGSVEAVVCDPPYG